MEFSKRITRAPLPYTREHHADMQPLVTDLSEAFQSVVFGAAGCSPYLRGLVVKEADLLTRLDVEGPEAVRDAVLASVEATEFSDLKPELRRAKRQIALLAGLADLAGVWPLELVTDSLTRLADVALDTALKQLVGREIERGKLPGMTAADAPDAAGMCILAMGKMGAGELNYSSDIDLICLFDESRFDPDDYHAARATFVRITRALMAVMSEVTGDGYVFRTDLRLRPDASVTPVCIAMETAERYYESVGRTWERAAFIKARACAGDIAAGEAFLQRLTPFVWRKHLDFAAITDAHDMRLRIRSHKGLAERVVLEGHNMKLGVGGIREIEFFTQTRQLIAGGRDPDLRVRGTVAGLARLAAAGWIAGEVADTLTQHYRAHREVEHRLQMIGDAQTHDLPGSADGFDRIARFSGYSDTATFRGDIRTRLQDVAALTDAFFAPDEVENSSEAVRYLDQWQSFPALRSERAVDSFMRLFPPMLDRLKSASDPNSAINTFEQFLRGLPAGVQVFSLFEANPSLGDLIVDICSASPALASYLGRNSGVLDAVIGGDFFVPWPGADALQEALSGALDSASDFEAKLDVARRWQKEWHFRVGVHHMQGLVAPEDAGRQYADLAYATVGGLLPVVCDQVAKRHGPPPGRGAIVLGMGSLGAGVLTARSDLDLIVVYDASAADSSDGARPLPTRSYFARLTQTLVTALSAPTAEGRLYEVDMRLRPSGQSGPVATSLQAFEAYQTEQAWVWEHLALTRANPIAGDAELQHDVSRVRDAVLRSADKRDDVIRETHEMRVRLAQVASYGDWDVKSGPGGAQDIDLFGQAASVFEGRSGRNLEDWLTSAVSVGWCEAAQAQDLLEARQLYWRVTQAIRLVSDGAFDPDVAGTGSVALMLRDTEAETVADLIDRLKKCRKRAKEVIDRVISPQ